jgi:DNA-directed RNA polymerase specialized sigma24 family protein
MGRTTLMDPTVMDRIFASKKLEDFDIEIELPELDIIIEMGHLNDAEKLLLKRIIIECMTYQRLSDIYGCSKSTAYRRYRRVLKKLASCEDIKSLTVPINL